MNFIYLSHNYYTMESKHSVSGTRLSNPDADHIFFKQMLNLVPANFYFNKDVREQVRNSSNKRLPPSGMLNINLILISNFYLNLKRRFDILA